MNTLKRCTDYLEEHGVRFATTRHPVAYTASEVATVEHVPPSKVAKTVVFHTEAGFGLAVVPACSMVQLDELGLILGVHHVRLATETELGVLFPGCELGAMPPFGNLFGLPVYLAAELANEEFFSFNGGTHRDLIHMEMRDFRRLARPVIADIAVAAPVA